MNASLFSRTCLVVFVLLLLIPPDASIATTIAVRQDGTGDFLTITEAVAAASSNDTIDVGPGTYAEGVDVTVPLVFIASGGPGSTTMDGEDAHSHLRFTAVGASEVTGFEFVNGYRLSGGSVKVGAGTTVTLRECHFESNSSGFDGGALIIDGGMLLAQDCTFVGNHAIHNGGAAEGINGAHMTFTDCRFEQNTCDTTSAGVGAHYSTMDITGCLFVDNVTGSVAGAVYYYQSGGVVSGNTFYGNTAPGTVGGTIVVQASQLAQVTRNVIAGETAGYGLRYYWGTAPHSCNVFWMNAAGSIGGDALAADDVVADPLFCDAGTGDFTISEYSPAAPANSACGQLIGAFGPVCMVEPPVPHRILVRQDGTGDFLTITEAVAAASSNDTIDVGPGTYAESVDVHVPLVLAASSGLGSTTMDGEGTHNHLVFSGWGASEVTGFTFVNGYQTSGGSVRVGPSAAVAVTECRFENNTASYDGGALYVHGGTLHVQSCAFVGNHADHNGAAAEGIDGTHMTFADCRFEQNTCGVYCAGVGSHYSTMDVTGCLFAGNVSGDVAGAVYYYESDGTASGNTFYANTSPGEVAGTIVVQASSSVVTRNVIVGETAGYGLRYYWGTAPHSCNVFWLNTAGSIGEDVLAASDVVADPLFCDAGAGDFTISEHSPAAPANSACNLLIGAFGPACTITAPTGAPVIMSILDVPEDNGWQVRIKWQRSSFDMPGQPYTITQYGVYRYDMNQEGARALAPLPPAEGRQLGTAIEGWDFVATVPARCDDIYQYVAPTLCNATPHKPCWSVFFVSAMTSTPSVFFDSEPDSGYSVDNLPPAPPVSFALAQLVDGNELTWDASESEDTEHYNIYRASTPGFEPGETNLVHSTAETEWMDHDAAGSACYYKLTAVDGGGNESEALAPGTITGSGVGGLPRSFALRQNSPNPFNPWTVIEYDIPPGAGRVTLQIFDANGKLVRTLVDRVVQFGGTGSVTWDGSADGGQQAPSGVYFARMTAPGFSQTRKMVLLK